MRFITLVPFLFWIYLAVSLMFYFSFGLGGRVIAVIAMALLSGGM